MDETLDRNLTIARRTLTSELVDQLRDRILSLEIPEGAQLRQDRLAAQFGVSRIPVREALLQLEGEGLVAQEAHKGWTVAVLSLQEIGEEFDLRALLEVDLLRRALPRMTPAHLAAARAVLETFDEVLAKGEAEENWGKLNWRLHAALYAPAGRPRSLRILQNLHRNADRYLRLQLNLTRRSNERAREEHRRLVDLCEARDLAEATRLLHEHILNARDELLDFLAKRRSLAAQ